MAATANLVHSDRPQPGPSRAPSSAADGAGVVLSVACGIHCLLTPILLLALPSLGEAFHNPLVHKLIAVGVTIIAVPTLWRGYTRHRNVLPLILGFLGMLAVWSALLIPHDAKAHERFHLPAGTIITIIGSVLLISGHVLNIRNCRSGCCHRH